MTLALPGLGAFRHRNFALFGAANFLATIAMQMQAVAIGWQVYDLTASPFRLGMIGLAEFLPAIGLALVVGPVADRFDRRRIMLLALGGEALCSVGLLFLAVSGHAAFWPILAIASAFGTARAFVAPASRAMMPSLVPPELLNNAVAWSSVSWQVATIGGPALGGFIYLAGPDAVYGTAAVALAAAIGMIFLVRYRRPAGSGKKEAIKLGDVLGGLRLIFSHKVLLGAISLDLFAVLFSSAIPLLPVFAKDVLHTGPEGLGLLRAAAGVGAVTTALILTQRPIRSRAGRKLFICVGLFGLCVITFGLSESFWLSLGALFCGGACDMVSVYIRGTVVPLATPDHLRGRVMAVEAVFVGASNELGAFWAGSMASLIGAVPAVVLGGSATLLVVLSFSRLFRKLATVDKLDTETLGFSGAEARDKVTPAGAA
ncbi:MAG TPA: MFS transporter [Hypericibacter adhaerens]|jgi:MFS family permease|uniref:MFS transporter n=1 Tax=Hypericibacter adhaerens TaxID=2602016 RepID=A0A5J6MUW9_9PROT|nr:MFS transporter [Hypericibacter adhaerens]QEX20545.1 MFS transporter [Hypericibacter adhaerens]HWA44404.1 MFS transporter [Hypericibacter adhaerens]